MPYTLNKTDGSVLLTLADGTKNDTITSLTFIGKNFNNYGESFNENFLKLLEHFASATPPSTPTLGQLWYDKTNSVLKVYKGPIETWKIISIADNISGTTNQIISSVSATGTTLSLPQNIHTLATPTFRNLTLTESAVGSAPLVVNSTNLITNLNADLLDGKQGSFYSDYTNLTNKPTFGTIANLNTVALGTNTSGNYVKTVTAGSGLKVDSGTGAGTDAVIRHDSTSVISGTINTSNISTDRQFVKNITMKFDSFGHATEATFTSQIESSAIKTIIPFNNAPESGYTWVNESTANVDTENKRVTAITPETTIEIFAGTSIDIKVDNAKKAILIEHTDTSSTSSTNNTFGNVVSNVSVDGQGHVTQLNSVDLDTRYLTKNGGTLTGNLTLPTNNSPSSLHAVTKAWFDQWFNAQFVGTIAYFPLTTAPSGWLACDGSEYSKDQYPLLWNILKTLYPGSIANNFKVPDLRGEFIRGWDGSRGVDSGRGLGTFQKGSLIGYDELNDYVWALSTTEDSVNSSAQLGMDLFDKSLYPTARLKGGSTTDSIDLSSNAFGQGWVGVSRPRNIAMLACIRADIS